MGAADFLLDLIIREQRQIQAGEAVGGGEKTIDATAANLPTQKPLDSLLGEQSCCLGFFS
jgi:hypothetical protein